MPALARSTLLLSAHSPLSPLLPLLPRRFPPTQIVYHYTRDRAVLAKALLRRGCVPHCATPLPATGLLDPAYQAYHSAAMDVSESHGCE